MNKLLLPLVATLALAGGCYTRGDVGVGYSYGYAAPAPSLYYVSPGVQVVAYSDDPVFYSDGYYWRYDGGLWYRSGYYSGGWVAWNDVPYSVRTIDRPYRYARYQPGTGWSGGGGTYQGGVGVRDHRSGYYETSRTAPPPATYSPTVRDHRAAPAATYAPPPGHAAPAAGPGPDVRDHRGPSASPAPVARPAPGPDVRDHRRH